MYTLHYYTRKFTLFHEKMPTFSFIYYNFFLLLTDKIVDTIQDDRAGTDFHTFFWISFSYFSYFSFFNNPRNKEQDNIRVAEEIYKYKTIYIKEK